MKLFKSILSNDIISFFNENSRRISPDINDIIRLKNGYLNDAEEQIRLMETSMMGSKIIEDTEMKKRYQLAEEALDSERIRNTDLAKQLRDERVISASLNETSDALRHEIRELQSQISKLKDQKGVQKDSDNTMKSKLAVSLG